MLQIRKPFAAFEVAAPQAGPDLTSDLLSGLFGVVRRQRGLIILIFLLAIGIGGTYLATAPAYYTATATLLIDTRKNQLFQQQSVLSDIPVDTASVESQVQILRSESIALAVIKTFNLTEDAEFDGSGGLVGSLLDSVADLFGGRAPRSEFEQLRYAAEAFADRLSVRRVGLTYILEINFRSLSAERSAAIANALANTYVTDLLDAKYKATQRASIWLQERIQELRGQASVAERSVVEFKTKNNIVESGGRLMNEQELAELNSQLVLNRAQVSESKARLDRIQAVIRADSPDTAVNGTVADSFNNQVITKLRSQYLELANREADWAARYGRDHMAAINLRNQMREIRGSILDELRRLSESYKSDYAIARQREEGIQAQLSRAVSQSQITNQAQVALRELESSAQTYRALYDNFLQRYMESVQQQSFPITEARLITEASRPLKKSSPRPALVMVFASFGGLLLGLGLARLRDQADRVFRTSEQVEAVLRKHCIALLPALGRPKKSGSKEPIDTARRLIPQNSDSLFRHVIDAPFSRFTESIRAIKVAADLEIGVKSAKVLGFTSALPNEGKSTVASAFAQLVAQTGARTILVDCDLRNPSLTKRLAPGSTAGLQDVLSGKVGFADALWTDQTGIAFLPATATSRAADTSEILASDIIKALFDQLRGLYDYIIVDLSPLAPVVDVRRTVNFVDSYVFVIEWGHTKIDVVERALHDSAGVSERVAGVVLNKADVKALSRYGYGGYYQNRYYGRYGYVD